MLVSEVLQMLDLQISHQPFKNVELRNFEIFYYLKSNTSASNFYADQTRIFEISHDNFLHVPKMPNIKYKMTNTHKKKKKIKKRKNFLYGVLSNKCQWSFNGRDTITWPIHCFFSDVVVNLGHPLVKSSCIKSMYLRFFGFIINQVNLDQPIF